MTKLPLSKLPVSKLPLAKLSVSLSIALWLVGSLWAVAILAHVFDAPHEIVHAAFAFGLFAGVLEWLAWRRSGK